MCQLRGHLYAPVEAGRDRALPVQRVRAVPQDERRQQAAQQAAEEAGQCLFYQQLKIDKLY